MKIFVTGSHPELENSDSDIAKAMLALGYECARRGYSLVLGRTAPNTVDHRVFQGYSRYCSDYPDATRAVEFHLAEGDSFTNKPTGPPNLQLKVFKHSEPPGARRDNMRWARVTAGSVGIVVAGELGTAKIAALANYARTPLLPVAIYGGTSASVYYQVRSTLKPEHRALLSDPDCFSTLELLDAAQELAEDTERATATTSYFISYSRVRTSEADHLELELRRRHRNVIRDETRLEVGEGLDEGLKSAIMACDIFMVLWDANYSQSAYCKGELRFASKLRDEHGSRPRIIVLRLDDEELPLSLGDCLWYAGDTRDARTLAVYKLLEIK